MGKFFEAVAMVFGVLFSFIIAIIDLLWQWALVGMIIYAIYYNFIAK